MAGRTLRKAPAARQKWIPIPLILLAFLLGWSFYLLSVSTAGERQDKELQNTVLAQTTAPLTTKASRRDADGCYHVYLDVGANIGIHGRFLFEPEKYPDANFSRGLFDAEFGKVRDNRDICVFCFEPNPNNLAKLAPKAKAYEAMGWRYHIMPVGASDRDGNLTFHHQGDGYLELGFSVKKMDIAEKGKVAATVTVPIIHFAKWLDEHVNNRRIPDKVHGAYPAGPKVVMKLDIEASEYVVLPDLMLSGAMCGIDFMFGEFHPSFAPLDFPGHRIGRTHKDLQAFQDAMLKVIPGSRNCKTRFQAIDDEEHIHDGMPLPTPMDGIRSSTP
jgi:FkbM family methyltransferase